MQITHGDHTRLTHMPRLENLFLNTDYVLYLNVLIGSVLAVGTYTGAIQDRLLPFLSGWMVLFIITSSLTNRFRYERISDRLSRLEREEPDLIETLSSNREAYEYLTENLSWTTEFRNTVYGTNPPELKKYRADFTAKCHERLRSDDFKMHEVLALQDEHVAEAREKNEVAAENYYCSFVDDEGCPLLPFSVLKNDARNRAEVVLGWYGEVLEPHSEDEYLVIRERNVVDLMLDHFDNSFDLGDRDVLANERDARESPADRPTDAPESVD